jgi:UDP-N-acetylmuramate dehydrogenase
MTQELVPRRDVPLAERTTLKLGGPAEFLTSAADASELAAALDWARARGLDVCLLGGGSNVVVADAGIRGLVLTLSAAGEQVQRAGDEVHVSIGAGASWDEFVARAVQRDWAGLECLSGIPGQVGATPIQNVGAYGQEVADSLLCVQVYDRAQQAALELAHAECGFGYRSSRFKQRDAGRFIVLGASFRLRAGGAPCLAYPEIARRFAGRSQPSLAEVRELVRATRREKSMLLDAGDENARSCGSFFLNPVLAAADVGRLSERAGAPPPQFPQADGSVKLPAAWLIERAGFHKGQRWGAVGISSKHSLALVCHAGASSRQLLEAAHRVRDGVAQKLGIWLSPEPQFLGFGSAPDGLPPL